MPKSAERKAAGRGGVSKYRTIKRGDKTLRCMITRKKGPQGGKTICYPLDLSSSSRKSQSSRRRIGRGK